MFKEFFSSLLITDKNDLGKNHETGVLSLTAIFIRIAKLDGVFDKEELQEIRNFLNRQVMCSAKKRKKLNQGKNYGSLY